MAQANAQTVVDAVRQIGGNIVNALTMPMVVGGAAGHLPGVLRAFAMLPMPGIVKGFIGLEAALLTLPFTIAHFNDSIIQANRSLAAFSPSMAYVIATEDARNMLRNIRRGEMLADSVNKLALANTRLKDSSLGLEVAFERAKNSIAESAANFAELPFRAAEKHPQVAGKILGAVGGGLFAVPEALEKGLGWLEKIAAKLGLIDDNTKKDADLLPMASFFNEQREAVDRGRIRNDDRFGKPLGFGLRGRKEDF